VVWARQKVVQHPFLFSPTTCGGVNTNAFGPSAIQTAYSFSSHLF
jgi:hypothetical protein